MRKLAQTNKNTKCGYNLKTDNRLFDATQFQIHVHLNKKKIWKNFFIKLKF